MYVWMNVVKEYAVRDLRYFITSWMHTIYKVDKCNIDPNCMRKTNSVIL